MFYKLSFGNHKAQTFSTFVGLVETFVERVAHKRCRNDAHVMLQKLELRSGVLL